MAIHESTEPTAIAKPAVSVVIPTRNRPQKIGGAVQSVLAVDHPSFELLVIDQSSDDATGRILRPIAERDHRLVYVHVDEPGVSRARNTGVRLTTAPIIAFTDDDCIVPVDWLRCIEAAFEAEQDADLLYGQVNALPVEHKEGAVTPSLVIPKAERLSKREGFRIIGMSANFAARRRVFTRTGGFDEALGGGGPLEAGEDFDLAFRTYRNGFVILLRPEVVLLHDGQREAEDWPEVLRRYGIGDGAFYAKHVRCGDLYALSLLVRHLWHHAIRQAVKRVVLRQAPPSEYFLGLFVGIREGFKYSVDRTERRYKYSLTSAEVSR